MEELLEQLSGMARGMWRFRWHGLAVAWIVAVIGGVVVWRMPDRYEASARIYVDTQSILRPLMSGLAVQPNVDQQLQMLSRTLISRPNVEKLIHMANLDLKSASTAEQEALIESLSSKLSIKSVGKDNFYTLSYLDSNPEKARRVIQSLVSIFVESSLGASRQDTNSAKLFLDEQIKAYRAKLEDAEARVKEFRLRNIEMQSGDGKDSASRLSALGSQLEGAKLQLREAETARDAARAQLAGVRNLSSPSPTAAASTPEGPAAVSTPEIDARLDVQRRHLDELLQRFTDQHPEVQATRRLVKELEEQKKREVEELRRTSSSGAVLGGHSTSLAYQETAKLLANSEVQVASLRARVEEYSTRYAAAREALKNAPTLEAEAAQLNRDYDIHKRNYEMLVARRESATMSGQLEDAGVAEFRLIDPPRVPSKPAAPNRMMMLPVVLVAALVVGVVTTFGLSRLRPVFFLAGELRRKLELPLLGVVTLVLTEAQIRQERTDRLRFLGALGGMVALLMVVMALAALKSMK